jgi:hypothetical protein
MSNAANKRGKLDHPKTGARTHNPHFAAFGTVDIGVTPQGILKGQKSQAETSGKLVYKETSNLNPDQLFWIMGFKVKEVQKEKYTLRIIDEATGKDVVDPSTDIDISSSFGPVVISYPPSDTQDLPEEFAAYGTGDEGYNVTGRMDNCDEENSEIDQIEAPPDWILYCFIVAPGPSCNLTVSQPDDPHSTPGSSVRLTFD